MSLRPVWSVSRQTRTSFKTARATQRNPILKTNQPNKQKLSGEQGVLMGLQEGEKEEKCGIEVDYAPNTLHACMKMALCNPV